MTTNEENNIIKYNTNGNNKSVTSKSGDKNEKNNDSVVFSKDVSKKAPAASTTTKLITTKATSTTISNDDSHTIDSITYDGNNVDSANNPYLALREAKIARNQARLRELGLLSGRGPRQSHTIPRTSPSSEEQRQQQQKISHQQQEVKREETELRRSKRKTRRPVTYQIVTPESNNHKKSKVSILETIKTTTAGEEMHSTNGGHGDHKIDSWTENDNKNDKNDKNDNNDKNDKNLLLTLFSSPAKEEVYRSSLLSSSPSLHVSSIPTSSAKYISIDSNYLVLGDSCSRRSSDCTTNSVGKEAFCGLLGLAMSKTGKAFVMEQAATLSSFHGQCNQEQQIQQQNHQEQAHSSSYHYDGSLPISFNKYSGVQEWYNDVLFLWVNIGGPGDIQNDFLDGGKRITWYGGSRMHDGSNSIQRLIRVGKKAAAAAALAPDNENNYLNTRITSNPDCSGIVLWCRYYSKEKRTFEPYICMGRLAYCSHIPGSRPLSFIWRLLDYDRLLQRQKQTNDPTD